MSIGRTHCCCVDTKHMQRSGLHDTTQNLCNVNNKLGFVSNLNTNSRLHTYHSYLC